MSKVTLKNNENFDKLLRRFKKSCEEEKIIETARDNVTFEKPSEAKRIAKKAAIKRHLKKKSEELQNKKRLY